MGGVPPALEGAHRRGLTELTCTDEAGQVGRREAALTLKILGHRDKLSVAPGETVRFMVSCEAARYRAEIVRIIHGDANPQGRARLEPVATPIAGEYPGASRRSTPAPTPWCRTIARLRELGSFTVMAMVWPTTPGKRSPGADRAARPATGAGFALEIRDGGSRSWLGDARGGEIAVRAAERCRSTAGISPRRLRPREAHVTLVQRPLTRHPHTDDEATVTETVAITPGPERRR